MIDKSILEIQKDLADKKYSYLELVNQQLALIRQSSTNSVIHIEDNIIEKVKEAEKNVNSEAFGMTILHKDNIAVKDQPLTCSSKMLQNFISPYNATLVQKLEDEGAICLGKTNLDEFGMGSSTSFTIHNRAKNPWDKTKTPGGSSGGSAAAIAEGLASVATGTDTGGSIRQPASFCGISGLKPTYGTVSRYGVVAYASSLDQAGPMAKHVSDVALAYNIIATKDSNDSKMAHAKDITQKILQDDIKGKTIGVAIEWIESLQNPHLKNYYKEAIKTYKELGAYVKNIQITNLEAALPCYYVISAAEAASNLARFDGMRYGYRSSKENKDIYKANRSESFGNEVKRRILLGNFVLSSGSENKYYQKARKVRALIQENYLSILKNVDAILAPATTGTAFEPGTQSVIEAYENDKFTVGVNLSGLPSLALPIGFDDGMPIGMQLIGKHMSDNLLLNLGHAFQKRTTWHKVSPVTL